MTNRVDIRSSVSWEAEEEEIKYLDLMVVNMVEVEVEAVLIMEAHIQLIMEEMAECMEEAEEEVVVYIILDVAVHQILQMLGQEDEVVYMVVMAEVGLILMKMEA